MNHSTPGLPVHNQLPESTQTQGTFKYVDYTYLDLLCLEWLPCPLPGHLSYLGTEPTSPVSPALQVDSLPTGNSLPGRSHVLYLSQGIPWLRR